eukprot:scaffold642_cov74-Attheya_sp.AAC.1
MEPRTTMSIWSCWGACQSISAPRNSGSISLTPPVGYMSYLGMKLDDRGNKMNIVIENLEMCLEIFLGDFVTAKAGCSTWVVRGRNKTAMKQAG